MADFIAEFGEQTHIVEMTQGAKGDTGATGSAGANAYTYIAYASDDTGTGFTMTFNEALNYIAIKSTTTAIASPVASDFAGLWKNYKGATGATGSAGSNGTDGTNGDTGWSPQFSIENDSERRVLKVIDWQGGTGTKPTTGLYVGSTGLVVSIADGVDVRGSVGASGTNGANGAISQIQEDGSNLTVRPTLNFIGNTVTATDNSVSNRTDITVTTDNQTWIDIQRQGFLNTTETTISFDPVTYIFTIAPTATTWSYYYKGIKYTITGSKTSTLAGTPPTAATYYMSLNSTDGTLSEGTTSWTLEDQKIPVATINWNNANTPKYWLADERHTVLMDYRDQYYIHTVEGTRAITLPTITGTYVINSSNDADKTFGLSASSIMDQDLKHDIALLAEGNGTTTPYVVWYRTGASTWTWKYSDMPFIYNVGNTSNIIQYDNNGTMTNGTIGTGGSTRYVNSYILVTNKGGDARYIFIAGRNQFTTVALAQAENISAFTWAGFMIEESVIVYRCTWKPVTTAGKGQAQLAIAPQQVNISTVTNASSGAGTDHNSLANLQGGTSNEYYHLTATESTEIGALANNTTNGIWARTGTGTGSARTITGTANEITVTNGDGVSGNPTISLSPIKFNIPEGYFVNGKISVTVASNNITVALKGLDGNNPSASNPVYVNIAGTIRSIISSLSVTLSAGTNWFNSGSTGLATQEIDYFVYLGYNATDGVVIGFARFPTGMQYSDFSTTTTNEKYCAISTITTAASTDYYNVIGRFAATLSATASFNWSVPTFTASNLVQKPIDRTRPLTFTPTATGFSSTPTNSCTYWITGMQIQAIFSTSNTTSNATSFTLTVPFSAVGQGTFIVRVLDNTVWGAGLCAWTTNLTLYKTVAADAFTASGGKGLDSANMYVRI